MMSVYWSATARADLAELDRYYHAHRPDYAERIGAAALRGTYFLTEHPAAGPLVGQTGVRKWKVANTPYILLYRASANDIRILRVAHSSTDWQDRL